MVRIKYVAQQPPANGGYNSASYRPYLMSEFKRIEFSIDVIAQLLKVLEVPIEVGAADSGGIGYRILRIPN